MLVLSRMLGEKIMIGDDIVLTVTDIRGDKVRLGIEAPADTSVHREEIWNAIQAEREAGRRDENTAIQSDSPALRPRPIA